MEILIKQGDITQATIAALVPLADTVGVVGTASLAGNRITVPTMKHPAEPIPPKHVELATVVALRCADESGFASVAVPVFGTAVGDVDYHTAVRVMSETIEMFRCDNELRTVELWVDRDRYAS